jgi:glycosyltransferase involved in cell wall biosynthesis
MKIGMIVASLDILGGHSVQAAQLLESLSREPGIEAEIIPINPRLPGPIRFLQKIKYVRTSVTSIVYLITLLIKLPRFDVVHVFSASYLSFLLAPAPAVLIARLFRKPVLLNYHSGEAEDHLRRWKRTALPIIRLADCVVTPSEYLARIFASFGVSTITIPNIVDLSRFPFVERTPLLPVLLSNRNFEPHYNVECILRAFSIVLRQRPDARLIVAGDGSERTRLRRIARELDLTGVEFTGPVSPERMPLLYKRADVFINASDIDNQPLSIIEAFASGLPVITTDAGGIPFLVSHNETGFVVRRGDHQALAENVLLLLSDRDLALRMARRAHQETARYCWGSVRDTWLTVYSELAARRVRRVKEDGESGAWSQN